MSVHGQVVTGDQIQEAVIDTIDRWIVTYLAEIERQTGMDPQVLPAPRSYVRVNDEALSKWPEDQIPAVVVLTPGTSGESVRDGAGIGAGYAVNVAVIVSARDQEATNTLAQRYAAAMLLLFTEQPSLGGVAVATTWQGQRWDPLPAEDGRTLAAAVNVFEVHVDPVVETGKGLNVPPDDPYAVAELPTVTETEIETEIQP